MAHIKRVSEKPRKPRKRKPARETIDVTDLRMPVSRELLEDAAWTPSREYLVGEVTRIFGVPMLWMLGFPCNPITRSAHELKAAAGPGPYHCNSCGETYGFYHPPCKPKPVVPADIRYVFEFDGPLCCEDLDQHWQGTACAQGLLV